LLNEFAAKLAPVGRRSNLGQTANPRRVVVRNAYIITMDPKLGDIPNGDVHVRNGALVAVGPNLNAGGSGS
jgi:imidazolonepropionase-like amidohydrolase